MWHWKTDTCIFTSNMASYLIEHRYLNIMVPFQNRRQLSIESKYKFTDFSIFFAHRGLISVSTLSHMHLMKQKYTYFGRTVPSQIAILSCKFPCVLDLNIHLLRRQKKKNNRHNSDLRVTWTGIWTMHFICSTHTVPAVHRKLKVYVHDAARIVNCTTRCT